MIGVFSGGCCGFGSGCDFGVIFGRIVWGLGKSVFWVMVEVCFG